MIKEFRKDKLLVRVYESRMLLGKAAARKVAEKILFLLDEQKEVNIIFAAAPSQNEFLDALSEEPLPWNYVNAFQMDEYTGLPRDSPQTFGYFLRKKLFEKVACKQLYLINGDRHSPESECYSYAGLLQEFPPDIVCMGIGENCHIAFNDPHVADFNDPKMVKTVELDIASRLQQVNDACFPSLEEVPTRAITLTIPALLQGRFIYCIVPGSRKANAVYNTLMQPLNKKYPSTILRNHHNAILYLDADSSRQRISDL